MASGTLGDLDDPGKAMAELSLNEGGTIEQRQTIQFDFIKSNLYRVVQVDGAYGGVSPRLNVYMGLYSERPPIPRSVVHSLTENYQVGAEVREKRETRDAIIREVEVGVMMELDVAKSLVLWLQDKIRVIEEMNSGKIALSVHDVGEKR